MILNIKFPVTSPLTFQHLNRLSRSVDKGNGKEKFTLEQSMTAQRGSRGYSFTLSLTLALDWVGG
jgi:hypothetical protein